MMGEMISPSEMGSLHQEESSTDTSAEDNGSKVEEPGRTAEADLIDDAELCSPCAEEDNVRVGSEVFCVECKDYLCAKCRDEHRKARATRKHHLVENGDAVKEITESCHEHPGRVIDHFCEDHHALVCRACVDVSHSPCRKIRQIQHEARHVKDGVELARNKDNLNNLIETFKRLKAFKNKQVQKSRDQRVVCKENIRELRQRANEFFDRLEATADRDVDAEIDAIIRTTLGEEETFKSAIEALEKVLADLERVSKTGNDRQLYITLKRASQQVGTYSDFQAEVEKSLKDIDVDFREDERFRRVFSVVSHLGRVVVHAELTPCAKKSESLTSLSCKRKKVVPAGGHSVMIPGDRTTCYITGSVFMEDGRLLLADHNNRCIKMFDVNFKLLGCQVVTSRPSDIAVINQEQIVTSLMDEYTLLVLKVGLNIRPDRRIVTESQYAGLVCSGESLIFASCSSREGVGHIHVLNMEGGVIHQITNTRTGDPIFVRPLSLVLGPDDKQLFVSDLGQNAVVCLDVTDPANCRSVFVYKDRNLELRNGLALDDTGSIYVASGNRSIHQVSYTGTKVHEILTEKDGITGQPHCLSLSPMNDELLVAEFKLNGVKVFKFI